MLRPWLNSPNHAPTKSPHTRNFSCSSFKDIQALLNEEAEPPRPDPRSGTPPSPAVRKPSIFHRVRISASVLRAFSSRPPLKSVPERPIIHPNAQPVVIIYTTSLRVVRRTFEACRSVCSILRGFRIPIDERDVSMDSSFIRELENILGLKRVTLPRVFIGGRYVGGEEEIKQLNETGELGKLIGRLPKVSYNSPCSTCNGYRFIVCEECDGSHRVYDEEIGFRSCAMCNINGLIRCPSCFVPDDTLKKLDPSSR